jgi:hypothetical protein
MRRILCANKTIILSLVFLIVVVFLFLIGTAFYVVIYNAYGRFSLLKKIDDESAVLSEKILYVEGVPPHTKYAIEILFNDGGKLGVSKINHRGDGAVYISYVDDYECGIVKKNREGIGSKVGFEVWSAIIGVQLKTITDIIQNYHIIRVNIESWPDLYDYRKNNENFIGAVDRLFAENLVSDNFVTVEGQEYFVFKYNRFR